jgi:hypothetical protein
LIELFLIAILTQVNVLELRQTELGQPCKTVFLTERSLFLALSLKNPELIILYGILLFLRIIPPVIIDQANNILAVSNSFANLISILGYNTILIINQSRRDIEHFNSDFKQRRRRIGEQPLHL